MIIKIKECDLQYHIASFTKNEDILKEMLDKNYTVAYLKDEIAGFAVHFNQK